MKLLALIASIACLLSSSCCCRQDKELKSSNNASLHRPLFNLHIGKTWRQIEKKFGGPDDDTTFLLSDMIRDELREAVFTKLNEEYRGKPVREVFYEEQSSSYYFWFVRDEENEWKVVEGVQIPQGTIF